MVNEVKLFTEPENKSDSIREDVAISVVVLCYHSGQSIIYLFDELEEILKQHNLDYEIILVANDFADSKDETMRIVRRITDSNPRVIAITEIKKGMMGWDMLQGLNAAKGDSICVIDGDGQFPVDIIPLAYQEMVKKDLDMIKTYRSSRGDGLYRTVLSKSYNLVFNLMFPGLNTRDVNSKPKIIRREAYQRMNLQSTDWFIDAEIMLMVRKHNMRFLEIPVIFRANANRKSFVKFTAIIEFVVNLIRFRFKYYK